MLGEGGKPLSELEVAVREFQAREDRRVDLKGLRVVIDTLWVSLLSRRATARNLERTSLMATQP
jgi:hypothetical protein